MKRFEKELGYIKNEEVRTLTEKILEKVPEYFYTMPASTTGKYHPKYALGVGGLYRHVEAGVAIARSLFGTTSLWWGEFDDISKDVVIASLIVHDGWKKGLSGSKWTVHEHPEIASAEILKIEYDNDFQTQIAEVVADLVSTHMGEWTTNAKSSVVLKPPVNKLQRFVHLCDYLASRKFLELTEDTFSNLLDKTKIPHTDKEDDIEYCQWCVSEYYDGAITEKEIGEMVLREPRLGQTWKAFYGCSRYPKCESKLTQEKRSAYLSQQPDDYDVMLYDGVAPNQ